MGKRLCARGAKPAKDVPPHTAPACTAGLWMGCGKFPHLREPACPFPQACGICTQPVPYGAPAAAGNGVDDGKRTSCAAHFAHGTGQATAFRHRGNLATGRKPTVAAACARKKPCTGAPCPSLRTAAKAFSKGRAHPCTPGCGKAVQSLWTAPMALPLLLKIGRPRGTPDHLVSRDPGKALTARSPPSGSTR